MGVEDAPDDELRRHGAVPVVLLEAEDDVVAALAAEAVELRAETEGDGASGVVVAAEDAEAEVLAVADSRQLAELAGREEQRHARVPEAERRQAAQLGAELERELGAGDDGVDHGPRPQVVLGEHSVGMSRERVGERVHVLGPDREPGCRAVAAEAVEMGCTGPEAAVEVECSRRAT